MADINLPATPMKTVAQFLTQDSTQKYLQTMLKERTGSFVASLVSLSNTTAGLAKCEPTSLMFCGLKAAALNLPLDNNLGYAWAVPYKDNKTEIVTAQFQIGAKGYVQLGQRSGQYQRMNVIDVRQGELVSWDPFYEVLQLNMIMDPELRDKQPVIGYAAMFTLLNGFTKPLYWPKTATLKHAKRYSKAYNRGPWQTETDKMAMKTVLVNLLRRWGPMSVEMQMASHADQAVMIAATVDDEGVPIGEPIITYPDNPERTDDASGEGGDDGGEQRISAEDAKLQEEFRKAQEAKGGAQQTGLNVEGQA